MKKIANRLFYFRDKKGMTMIEVLMAMAIFAIGFLAIGTMVIQTTRNTTTGNIVTQATMIGRQKIEFLKTLPVDDMEAHCKGVDPEIIAPIFKRECDVDKNTDTSNLIEVKVSWNRRGQNRDVVLKTLSKGNGS
ncbi:prepilin-type N-terminal cleavage/methylation domain-containing protein [Thermodesulfobacteriota bacterium]